jgi:hypothetical protein
MTAFIRFRINIYRIEFNSYTFNGIQNLYVNMQVLKTGKRMNL